MINDNNIFVKTGTDSGYDIKLRHDFSDVSDALIKLGFKDRRLCIVSDSNVFPLYGSELTDAVNINCWNIFTNTN